MPLPSFKVPSTRHTNPLDPGDIEQAFEEKSPGQLAANILDPAVTSLYKCASAPVPGSEVLPQEQADKLRRFNIVMLMGKMGSMFNQYAKGTFKHRHIGGGFLDFNPRSHFELIANNIRAVFVSPSSLPGRFTALDKISQSDQVVDFGAGDTLQASSMIIDQIADLLVYILNVAKDDPKFKDDEESQNLMMRLRKLTKSFRKCQAQGLASQSCCEQMLYILKEILQSVPMIEDANDEKRKGESLILTIFSGLAVRGLYSSYKFSLDLHRNGQTPL
ncbi:hypothetical protein GZ77_05500 [Endozoicomonas montiporae]|uniref:Uncharacterized protein n=2 Tax=Endozoicomonas montiporae TaxID=1027273 RepID=A0A081NBX2_9GAMM|nr:hypothetical protein [Endozoicomonas montiporae]AMO56261.1 hypothetical protein EZMO1_2149 [Endozoicomonas montiporae CL-33]KEQ15945.1 hypothetical protein GZ77_05500 [Endozoicomonas montiporae]